MRYHTLISGLVGASFFGLMAGCDVEKTQEGNVTVPKYEVEKKQSGDVTLPKYDVTTPGVDVGTKKAEVTVPTVDVKSAAEKKAEKEAAAAAASAPQSNSR